MVMGLAMRAPKRPSLFKQRDLTRALRSAHRAGATKAKVQIGKDGVIVMDVDLTANTDKDDANSPWGLEIGTIEVRKAGDLRLTPKPTSAPSDPGPTNA